MNWTPVIGLVVGRAIDAVADGFRRKPKVPPAINAEDYRPKYEAATGETKETIASRRKTSSNRRSGRLRGTCDDRAPQLTAEHRPFARQHGASTSTVLVIDAVANGFRRTRRAINWDEGRYQGTEG